LIPLHVRIRRFLKDNLDKVLKYFSPTPSSEIIDKKEIKNILIVRINYRIGNMLFTTPIVQQLQEEFETAKIDVLVGEPFTKVLFSGFKNVENIFDFDRKLLKNPIKAIKYIKKLRAKKYDAVININGGSTSDRLATLLARATYKVAFCNKDIFTPINRCVKREDLDINHEALKPLELLKIFNIKPNYNLKLSISLDEKELKNAKEELNSLVGKTQKKVFGIFRNARYNKKLQDDFWKELIGELKNLDEDIIFVDILYPGISKKLQDDMYEYSNKNLRALAAFMANLDIFIASDTGPMHLASASGVSTIALFKATAPMLYGTLKENDFSLIMKDKDTKEIAKEILEHTKRVS